MTLDSTVKIHPTGAQAATAISRLTIDGLACMFEPGQTILEVASANGIHIPTLCYLPEAGHRDVCRICVVDVAGAGRLLPACSTPATADMVVETANERVRESRRMTLELLIGSGRHTCITCEALGACELSKLAYEYGVEPPVQLPDDEFPHVEQELLIRDYSKCILCGRCWAACTAIQVHGVVPHPSGRRAERHGGKQWYPLPDLDQCMLCGQCVDACPVGAIIERRAKGVARHWEMERIRTTCPHCGMGCQTLVHVRNGEVVKVTAAGDAPPNRGRLCRRGRFAVSELAQLDRLTDPLLRVDGELRPASWDEALDMVADRMSAIVARDGADAVAGVISPSHTNEDGYQAQKLFRAVFGTNNIDHRSPAASRVPLLDLDSPVAACYDTGALTVLEQARAILVVGDGVIDDYAVAGAAVRRAVREGGRLLVIDSGHNALGPLASVRVSVEPHAVQGVLNGIMSVLLAGELIGRDAAGQALPHQRELESLLAAYLPERVAEAAGVAPEQIRSIADTLTKVRPGAVCAALGVGDDVAGTWGAVVRLQALLDDIAGARSVTLPRGRGNAQGMFDMGVVPALLPGQMPVADAAARRVWAEAWSTDELPATPGVTTSDMLEGLAGGRIKALWACADDASIFQDAPADSLSLPAAFEAVELLVVQSPTRSELAEAATVVLPCLAWGEEDGTFVNAERRVSRVRRVRKPPQGPRPAWWVFRDVARRLGHEWPAPYPEAVWDSEIARLAPGLAGVTYEELERWGLCWRTPPAALLQDVGAAATKAS
jgi:predicted molibdopterin-dependent oxidoreductase YjgC